MVGARWTGWVGWSRAAAIAAALSAATGCSSTTSDDVRCGAAEGPCGDASACRGATCKKADASAVRGRNERDAGSDASRLIPRLDAGASPIDAHGADALPPEADGGPSATDGGSKDGAGETGTTEAGDPLLQTSHCGASGLDCRLELANAWGPRCAPPGEGTAGGCDYDTCAAGYYDVDGNRNNGCEYACPWNPSGANTRDLGGSFGCGRDDDCNGLVDDGLDLCADPENCGECGFSCTLQNAKTTACVSTTVAPYCDPNNTHCVVETCEDGYVDANGAPQDGCEYHCTVANGGVELCNGIDDDCDHLIDDADDTLNDPLLGVTCQGGDKGACAATANAGVVKCIDGIPSCCDLDSNNVVTADPARYPDTGLRNDVCAGALPPFVVRPGDRSEICNAEDDDCDGVVDGAATLDSGAICGSSVGTCHTGHTVCVTTFDASGAPISASLECPDATPPPCQ